MDAAAAAAKSLQSCPTLWDPIDGSPPGSPIPGLLQARTLEWVAISFSNAWKWKVKVKSLSRVQLFETPRTAAYQAPPSMGFSRQEYWSGVPLPSPKCMLSVLKKKKRWQFKTWMLASVRGSQLFLNSIIQEYVKSFIQKILHSSASCPVMGTREIAFCSIIYNYSSLLSLYYLLVLCQALHVYYLNLTACISRTQYHVGRLND